MRNRPLLAESIPDGTFGGARPRRNERAAQRPADPDAARHLAELAAAVREIDGSRGYGVNLRYRPDRKAAA